MKTITIIGANAEVKSQPTLGLSGSTDYIITGPEEMSVSDGFHLFEELYDHRAILYIALAKQITHQPYDNDAKFGVWRSKMHGDGTFYKDWFILGIGKAAGKQITYHLPMELWEQTGFAETLDMAPKWDHHTSLDVIERLKNL